MPARALDLVQGRITNVSPEGVVTIQCNYPDWKTLTDRGYEAVVVQMLDSRVRTPKQLRSVYALIRIITDHFCGSHKPDELEAIKYTLKSVYDQNARIESYEESGLTIAADKLFSMHDCPESLASEFLDFLINIMLKEGIPVQGTLAEYSDDIGKYLYACLRHKKCAVCGRESDLHHVEHVGMGRNRDEIIHEGMEVMPLCRGHHGECHAIGQQTFNDKYHLERGVRLNAELCEIYNLKGEKHE